MQKYEVYTELIEDLSIKNALAKDQIDSDDVRFGHLSEAANQSLPLTPAGLAQHPSNPGCLIAVVTALWFAAAPASPLIAQSQKHCLPRVDCPNPGRHIQG